jgi:hypothetical protein
MRLKVFGTKQMIKPTMGHYFRVGPWYGKAILVTPWFVVMKVTSDYTKRRYINYG